MVLIACVLLAAFPPGILFPQMAARMAATGKKKHTGATGRVADSNHGPRQLHVDESQDQEKGRDVGRTASERGVEE